MRATHSYQLHSVHGEGLCVVEFHDDAEAVGAAADVAVGVSLAKGAAEVSRGRGRAWSRGMLWQGQKMVRRHCWKLEKS